MNWDYNDFNKTDKNSYNHNKYCHKHYKEDNCERKVDKCYYKQDKCGCRNDYDFDKSDHNCQGCICELLRCFKPATLVDILLAGQPDFLQVTFLDLDPKSCCAYFLQAAAPNSPLIIDCQKIIAIRKNPVV